MLKVVQSRLLVLAIFFGIFLSVACSGRAKEKESHNPNDSAAAKSTPVAIKTKVADSSEAGNFLTLAGDSVTIGPFEVEVLLSPKAEEKITKDKETIVVYVFMEGDPKDRSKAKLEEDGSFFVASSRMEIQYGEVARFDSIKFPRTIYDQLVDKDVQFGLNVSSGRKSSPNNLLDCQSIFDKLSHVVNKKLTVTGKLIYGDD
jgi:hypothetical protein